MLEPRHLCAGGFFFIISCIHKCGQTLWGSVAASINTAMKGVVSEQTRRKGDILTNSKEALKKQADARFKKDERAREGTKAMLDCEAEGRAIREKTARLRALRLGKEAAEKNEGVAADSGGPLGARKKANQRAVQQT
ncbi:MAG: hypothetical protein WBZ16_20380 [Pseudolabrys sp.]